MKYQNPIIPGFHPDPSICRDGEFYYLVTSSFEYLPGVPLFRSRNLIQWEQVGHCLTRPSQIDLTNTPSSGGIFAPTIRSHQGRCYMITTNITKGTFYVYRDHGEEEWSNPIFLHPHIAGIDPSLFFEEGHAYVQMAGLEKGILQFEITIETGEVLGEPRVLSKGSGGRDVEAPHLYKKDGFYYLLCAEGGTREGHMVTIHRSTSLWGPYESCPNNPILTNRDQGKNPLQGCGHGDFIQDKHGDWWMVALAYRPIRHKHVLGRESILLPVTWEPSNWPVVSCGYAKEEIEVARDVKLVEQTEVYRDDFDQPRLAYEWNFLRSFLTDYSLQERPGYLVMKGSEETLNDGGSVMMIARRQQHHCFSMKVKLEVLCEKEHEEAGVCLYMDETHHMEFGILREEGRQWLIVRKHVGELEVVTTRMAYEEHDIYLMIQGNETTYSFQYGKDEEMNEKVDETLCAHLSTEVAISAFTGVYLGMYAYHQAIAAFDYFEYVPA